MRILMKALLTSKLNCETCVPKVNSFILEIEKTNLEKIR